TLRSPVPVAPVTSTFNLPAVSLSRSYVLVHCGVQRRTVINTVATARCSATSDTLVPADAVADSGPPRDNSAATIAVTVQTARALAEDRRSRPSRAQPASAPASAATTTLTTVIFIG